jgi:tripartite-type tricarboxylate transporter receptor subunit TctC
MVLTWRERDETLCARCHWLCACSDGAGQRAGISDQADTGHYGQQAGGTSDIFVRALGEELQKDLGQPVVVENRSGGGMNIAGRACADAANDGYTICLLPNETLTLNQFTFKSIPYDPEKDFDPITNAFINTQVMVVSSQLNVKSLDDLARLAKARRGTLSYSALAIPMQITFEGRNFEMM